MERIYRRHGKYRQTYAPAPVESCTTPPTACPQNPALRITASSTSASEHWPLNPNHLATASQATANATRIRTNANPTKYRGKIHPASRHLLLLRPSVVEFSQAVNHHEACDLIRGKGARSRHSARDADWGGACPKVLLQERGSCPSLPQPQQKAIEAQEGVK